MLPDRDRLRRRAAQPRLVALHRALGRLRSTIGVMNTGAHPDDEHNEMLATLRHQHGARIIVACSTRGEGGQNILGPERQGHDGYPPWLQLSQHRQGDGDEPNPEGDVWLEESEFHQRQ